MNESYNTLEILRFRGFLSTPPLWEDSGEFKFAQFPISEAQVKEPLPPLQVPERLVLGKRIEHFFQYYITHFSEKELLVANQQIIAEKVTLGELDFLIKSRTGEVEHVELVYKFYVYDQGFPSEKEKWIGPNRRDSLVRKLNRLNEHQFPLLYHEETVHFLKSLNLVPQKIKQKVCFRANLFVPVDLVGKELPIINNDCIVGFWIRLFQFTEDEFGNCLFYSPQKRDWPIAPLHGTTWYSFKQIKEQIKIILEDQRSPLLWMKTPQQDYFRFFIVWW